MFFYGCICIFHRERVISPAITDENFLYVQTASFDYIEAGFDRRK